MFAIARQQWPGATVKASSLDAYLQHLSNAVDTGKLTLPVVTGKGVAQSQVVESRDGGSSSSLDTCILAADACNEASSSCMCGHSHVCNSAAPTTLL
jgi:hypothetical protein